VFEEVGDHAAGKDFGQHLVTEAVELARDKPATAPVALAVFAQAALAAL
jgi:hypothetical protein